MSANFLPVPAVPSPSRLSDSLAAAEGLTYLVGLAADQPTGELIVYPEGSQRPWRLYLYAGRLIYATGGPHPVRLWRRWLGCYGQLERLSQLDMTSDGWQAECINRSLQLGLLSLQEAQSVIRQVLHEAIFGLVDCPVWQVQFYPHRTVTQPTVFCPVEAVVQQAQEEYQRCALLTAGYQDLPLPRDLPYFKAAILDELELRSHLSPGRYQRLAPWLSGDSTDDITLGDIVARSHQPLSKVLQWLAPFIHGGWIDLSPAADLPALSPVPVTGLPNSVVAWIDPSPLALRLTSELLTSLGYGFVAIRRPIEQLPLLLEQRPAAIVINTRLERMSGYQFCRLLRRMDVFDRVPIFMVVEQDSPVAAMRARLAGANQTMAKPLNPEHVGCQLMKYAPRN